MSRTIYALFVGVDEYVGPINNLNGCVNDVMRIEEMLKERITSADDTFAPLSLYSQNATRQAIIDGFRTHLSQASPDDVALFYYCGHGAQQRSPEPFWFLEPDRLDETIVCHDSRIEGGWDLADKELAQLLTEVAASEAHVLTIFDSCHSGSITRGEVDDVRLTELDKRQRPIDSYIVSPENAQALQEQLSTVGGGGDNSSDRMQRGFFKLPRGNHVAFSACRAEELAKEKKFGSEKRGVFSYFLQEALTQSNSVLTYRDLFTRVNARVRSNVSYQLPWIEATDPRDLNQPFLGGAVGARNPFFVIGYDTKARGWKMDGGALHSISQGSGETATTLALFAHDAPAETLRDFDAALGTATVRSVQTADSNVDVQLTNGTSPEQDDQYKAVVRTIAIDPLGVAFEGDAEALDLVRTALKTAGPSGGPSPYVVESNENEPQLRLVAEDNRYRIVRSADTYAMSVTEEGYDEGTARLVVARMEHIERWMRAFNLSNPNSHLPENAIKMEYERILEDGSTEVMEALANVRFAYEEQDGEWVEPEFMIRLTNTTQKTLYCALLDLNEDYAITSALIPGSIVEIPQGESVYANAGDSLLAYIPDEKWEQGITNLTERLKLIISDQEFAGDRLDQDELDVEFIPRSTRSVDDMNTLDQILGEVQTRNIASGRPRRSADWRTNEFMFTIVRPLEAVEIPNSEAESRSLGDEVDVRIKGHGTLRASASLANEEETTRNINGFAVPRLLTDHPNVVPFEFTATRAAAPGLNVLNLDVKDGHESVTPDQPLLLETDQTLEENEHVLPVGYDGEFYLPLGRVISREGGTAIAIEQLPKPLVDGEPTRSLGGAIKIYFQKIVSKRFGLGYDYPRLAAAEVNERGQLSADHNVDVVKAKVAEADRIVLYIHGIIGETAAMVSSARTGWLNLPETPAPLAERYDLILSFDYENLNTSIKQTAVELGQRLAEVGLGAGHGKTLHIVAHSMGGLVSRWYIEQEGGNDVVQHMVMLGTPNGGSPWPSIQDWAFATLGVGLNGLAVGAWPVHVLSSLLGLIEREDVGLDELNAKSDLLRDLSHSADPGVPYTIIAGETAIIPAALKEDDAQKSLLKRLFQKLNPTGNWLHAVSDLAFYNSPNDVAVSVESIFSVPDARNPQPRKLDTVACDHMSYFSTGAGLTALALATQEV